MAAFRATLEEIAEASLLLHVVDVSHPTAAAQVETVNDVLKELGVGGIPVLHVWNKARRHGEGGGGGCAGGGLMFCTGEERGARTATWRWRHAVMRQSRTVGGAWTLVLQACRRSFRGVCEPAKRETPRPHQGAAPMPSFLTYNLQKH